MVSGLRDRIQELRVCEKTIGFGYISLPQDCSNKNTIILEKDLKNVETSSILKKL